MAPQSASQAPPRTASPLAELLAGVRRMAEVRTSSARHTGRHAQDAEVAATVDELVDVVKMQQDLIENLLTRVSRLEGRDAGKLRASS